jgi:hypothetical protein
MAVQLIAVTGKEATEIQHDLGVSPTGEREDFMYSSIVGTSLPNGAYLLYIQDRDMITDIIECEKDIFARLSKGASLISCYVCTTTMASYACGWIDGFHIWSVTHCGGMIGIKHLETKGSLPSEFLDIRNTLFAKQEGEDGSDYITDYIFNVPIELFVALGGTRYNHNIKSDDPEPWEVLE